MDTGDVWCIPGSSPIKVPSDSEPSSPAISVEALSEVDVDVLIEASPSPNLNTSCASTCFSSPAFQREFESGPARKKRRLSFASSSVDGSFSFEALQGSDSCSQPQVKNGSPIHQHSMNIDLSGETYQLSASDSDQQLINSDLQTSDSSDDDIGVESKVCAIISSDSSSDISLSEDSDGFLEDEVSQQDFLFDKSPVTVEEAVVNLCEVYVENYLSKTALSGIIKFTKKVLPDHNSMPNNVRDFFKFIKCHAPPVQEICHMYCSSCFAEKSEEVDACVTGHCEDKDRSSFYEFPLAEQVKFMFEHRGLASAIDEWHKTHNQEANVIKDICDGSEIRTLKKIFKGYYDITIIWNTDGISVGDKSEYHLWPILFTFCEVPPRLRPYLISVNSIWYEKKEPPMELFTKPFVESLKAIHEAGGVTWTHPETKEVITSQVVAPIAGADAPARAALQNVKRFNGIYGCNNCEIKCGDVVVNGKRRHYYLFDEQPTKLRSSSRMRKQAEKTLRTGLSVKGVKGMSPLYSVPHLDVGKFVYPEYMHSLLLGVVKSFILLMLSSAEAGLKKDIKAVNKIILSLKVPDFLKAPQTLAKLAFYKAHEYRAWLLFFSLPVLEDFLSKKYFQHWMLLVGSTLLLLKEKITEQDLQAAELMLRLFVRDVDKLYSKKAYKYNTHQLLHLTLTVRRWGNLWANSLFMFEAFNFIITRMIHGTKHKGKELVENLKIATGFMALKMRTLRDGVLPITNIQGNEIKDYLFSDSELSDIAEVTCDTVKVFYRLRVGKTMYSCKTYDERVKKCNSFVNVKIIGGDAVGEIVCFVKLSNEDIWCFVDKYDVDHTRFFVHEDTRFQIDHIIPIIENPSERIFVSVDHIVDKLIKVRNYVCVRPNTIEVNM